MEIDGDTFVVNTTKYTQNLLNEEQNHRELQKAFEFFGYKKFEIRQQQQGKSEDENIEILNKYFDNQVKIIKKKGE